MSSAKLVIGLCVLALVFSLGYWQGQNASLSHMKNNGVDFADNTLSDERELQAPSQNSLDTEKVFGNKAQFQTENTSSGTNGLLLNNLGNENNENNDNSALSEPSPDASADELLTLLLDIANSDNPDDMNYFAQTMDMLRNAIKDDPSALQTLLDSFMGAEGNDRESYYIISVLQGSDIENKSDIFEGLASTLALQGTSESNEKLLHLVSSTGLHDTNPNVTKMLTDIALYSGFDTANQLYALDLLMPYQLDSDQKSTVVNELSLSISSMDEDQKSYAIENIMRFSTVTQRQEMADNYLNDQNDLATRVAVLSSLHSGTLKPSDKLRTRLFDIARNTNDPLSNHAKSVLMNVFDISNDEYQKLKR